MKARVRAGAVQVVWDDLRLPNQERVRDWLLRWATRGRERGLDLVAMPAFTGVTLLCALAGADVAFDRTLVEVVERHGPAAEEQFVRWGRETAAMLDIHWLPGSLLVPDEDGIRHRSYLFTPDPSRVAVQDQTHAGVWERSWGLVPADTLTPMTTPCGRFGLLVGLDAWMPEAARILTLQGCTTLLAPAYLRDPASRWRQTAGLWQQVQQNQVFGLEALGVGTLGDCRWRGRSGAYTVLDATEHGDGFLAQGPRGSRPGLAAAVFARDAVVDHVDGYPLYDHLNETLYRRYMPTLYEADPDAEAGPGDRREALP